MLSRRGSIRTSCTDAPASVRTNARKLRLPPAAGGRGAAVCASAAEEPAVAAAAAPPIAATPCLRSSRRFMDSGYRRQEVEGRSEELGGRSSEGGGGPRRLVQRGPGEGDQASACLQKSRHLRTSFTASESAGTSYSSSM